MDDQTTVTCSYVEYYLEDDSLNSSSFHHKSKHRNNSPGSYQPIKPYDTSLLGSEADDSVEPCSNCFKPVYCSNIA